MTPAEMKWRAMRREQAALRRFIGGAYSGYPADFLRQARLFLALRRLVQCCPPEKLKRRHYQIMKGNYWFGYYGN